MIVRLMGEGQWRLEDAELAGLNELDNAAAAALERGDEGEFRAQLERLAERVRAAGKPLRDEELYPSDLVVPPSDLSLDEAHELFSGDGLIPDLPAR